MTEFNILIDAKEKEDCFFITLIVNAENITSAKEIAAEYIAEKQWILIEYDEITETGYSQIQEKGIVEVFGRSFYS